jgi:hypothetical protein
VSIIDLALLGACFVGVGVILCLISRLMEAR